MLVHLPADHTAESVRDGLIKTMANLPAHLRGSLTWDQGAEMATHKAFSIATDMDVYFCDPASPWQRGSNENTNLLVPGPPSSSAPRANVQIMPCFAPFEGIICPFALPFALLGGGVRRWP